MLLAVDIGNSNIVLGLWNNDKWIASNRFLTHPVEAGPYQTSINQFLTSHSLGNVGDAKIMVSSVVPEATKPIMKILTNQFKKRPVLLDTTADTGLEISNEQPEKVGSDLIADAVAAYQLTQNNCIVVDFGTATTVMVVQEPGILSGGAICTGLKASKDALVGKAAQLFDMELKPPSSVIGKNTAETMQSGLVIGHVAMVEGLIERMQKETGSAQVVATGGFAEMLAQLTEVFDFVEPNLTLDGLRLIAERQTEDGSCKTPDGKTETKNS